MPLSNAEKQRRHRARNVIALTREPVDIALQLSEAHDNDPEARREVANKLREIANYLDPKTQRRRGAGKKRRRKVARPGVTVRRYHEAPVWRK